jgi:iron complex outermembrane recepter protein
MKLLVLLLLAQQTTPVKHDTLPNFDTLRTVRQLGEVIIRPEKPVYQQNAYGTVVNVANSIMTLGSSALQVLERSPGVTVDHRYNSLMLNGKSGVTVMLNGKLTHMSQDQLMTLLSGMSADDIEQIELMTTPPANFDAEGSAGIINIVLKKNRRRGTNASLSLTGGYGWAEKGTAYARIDHNTGKVGLHAAYSIYHDRTYNQLLAWGSEIVPEWSGETIFTYDSRTQGISNGQSVDLGLDARLSPKTTIGASLMYDYGHYSGHSINYASYTVLPDSFYVFNGNVTGDTRTKNAVSSVYVEKEFRKGGKLNLDMDYIRYTQVGPSSVQSSFLDKNGVQIGGANDSTFSPLQDGYSNTLLQVGVVKMDYKGQLSRHIKLETGVKGDYTWNTSASGILSLVNGQWVSRGGLETDVRMQEYIGGAYTSFHVQLDTLTTLVAGVRYEHSRTSAADAQTGRDTVNRILNGVFPDIFLTKRAGEHQTWVLSYTTRIRRPSYNELASFISYNDPVSVFSGNPFLQPTITHNLKLAYSVDGYTVSILASRDKDPIAGYQITKGAGSGLVFISPQNLDFQNNLVLEAILPLKVNKWWTINVAANGDWRQYRVSYTPQPFEKAFWSASATINQTFTLHRRWLIEVASSYNTYTYEANSKNFATGTIDLGIRKDLGERGGRLSLSVSNLLRTSYQGFIGGLTNDAFNTKANVNYEPETYFFPIVKLTYTRSFGGSAQRQERQGAQEERERIK